MCIRDRSCRGQTVANMSRPEVWAEYDRWNAVIANVVFPELDHVAPAYLDLEDEMLEEIASAMGVQAEDVEGSLANAVAATLDQSTCLLYTSPSPRDRTRSR